MSIRLNFGVLVWLLIYIGCHYETTQTLLSTPDNNIEDLSSTMCTPSTNKGRIVYVSYIGDWNGEIYVMNDDGSEQVRLTHHNANDNNPVWSPDGCKIAFTSNRDGETHIYIMNADGNHVHRLTNMKGIHELRPAWSPNGRWIVFQTITADAHGNTALQFVDLVSGEIRELINTESGYAPQFPEWSSDSQHIWFSSSTDQIGLSRSDLYTIHIESREIQRITYNGSDGWGYEGIKISPDDQQILHTTSARDPRAFILNVQALEVSRVFDFAEYKEIYPELIDEQLGANWSPDGNSIVFSMTTDTIYTNLYRLDFQTEQTTQLTNNPGHEMSPDWWAPLR